MPSYSQQQWGKKKSKNQRIHHSYAATTNRRILLVTFPWPWSFSAAINFLLVVTCQLPPGSRFLGTQQQQFQESKNSATSSLGSHGNLLCCSLTLAQLFPDSLQFHFHRSDTLYKLIPLCHCLLSVRKQAEKFPQALVLKAQLLFANEEAVFHDDSKQGFLFSFIALDRSPLFYLSLPGPPRHSYQNWRQSSKYSSVVLTVRHTEQLKFVQFNGTQKAK